MVDILTTEALGGLTVTVATGPAVTVSEAVPDLPPADAVIVAVPGLTPVATPVVTPDDETVAAAELLVHVTWRSVTVVPLASLTVAVNVVL